MPAIVWMNVRIILISSIPTSLISSIGCRVVQCLIRKCRVVQMDEISVEYFTVYLHHSHTVMIIAYILCEVTKKKKKINLQDLLSYVHALKN